MNANDVKNLLTGRTLSAFFENVKRIAEALERIADELKRMRADQLCASEETNAGT